MQHLTDHDLEQLRTALERERETLVEAIEAREIDERGIAMRETEEGDIAERMIAQETALRLGAFDKNHLAEVEHALAKLDDGTYGISEDSGRPIPVDRLRAVPWARRTLEEEEQRRAGIEQRPAPRT